MCARGDLPQRRRLDLEPSADETPSGRVEIMTLETRKCSTVYKQPHVCDRELIAFPVSTIDKLVQEGVDFILSGDLNVNVLELCPRFFNLVGLEIS